MGHKWLWNRALGGLPPESFLVKVDPLLAGVREKLDGEYAASDQIAGTLSKNWAEKLGLKAGIPIPVGAFDAHWDAIGAGCGTDDMVNVVGTSTCIIGITPSVNLVPGVCGVVQGSVHPLRTGSKPDSPPSATSSTQSRPAPARTYRRLARAWRTIASHAGVVLCQ